MDVWVYASGAFYWNFLQKVFLLLNNGITDKKCNYTLYDFMFYSGDLGEMARRLLMSKMFQKIS